MKPLSSLAGTLGSLLCLTVCVSFAAQAAVFQPAVNYPVGADPTFVAVGDFNGDGNLDLAVTNSNVSRTGTDSVSILLGNGDGTFGSATNFPAGLTPHCVAVGDFNSDHRLDLVVANQHSQDISILLGDGHGQFRAPISIPAGYGPYYVATADFNGDKKEDVVVANLFNRGARITVMLGNGDATFQPPVVYDLARGMQTRQVQAFDVDGDGNLDLLATNSGLNGNEGGVSLLLGDGLGNFHLDVTFRAGKNPYAMTFADVNPSNEPPNYPDLVVADADTNEITVRWGNGNGTFQGPRVYATGTTPTGVVVGFFDHDGQPDMVASDAGSNDITFLGSGLRFPVGVNPQSITAASLKGGFNPDVAVPNQGSGTVSILLSN